jgi:hypothetical protein
MDHMVRFLEEGKKPEAISRFSAQFRPRPTDVGKTSEPGYHPKSVCCFLPLFVFLMVLLVLEPYW